MFTQKVLFIVLIIFIMGTILQAQDPEGTIVFTTRPDFTDPATEESPDMHHVYALEDAGYDVVTFYNASLGTASEATLDTLYDANLIIMGRSTPSTDYGNHKEVWNDITTPILNLELWNCRSSRLNWFATEDMIYYTEIPEDTIFHAIIEVPDDPVFDGLDTSSPVPWISTKRPEPVATTFMSTSARASSS